MKRFKNDPEMEVAQKILGIVGMINSISRIPFIFKGGKFSIENMKEANEIMGKYVAPVTEELAKHYAKEKGILGKYVLYQNAYELAYYICSNIYIYKFGPLLKARLATAMMHNTTILLHKMHLGVLASMLHMAWNKSAVDHKGFLVDWHIDLTDADKRERSQQKGDDKVKEENRA